MCLANETVQCRIKIVELVGLYYNKNHSVTYYGMKLYQIMYFLKIYFHEAIAYRKQDFFK